MTVVGVTARVHGKETEGERGSEVKLSAPPVSRPRRSFLTGQEARAAMGDRTGLRSYYDSYEHVVDSHLRSEWDDVGSSRNYGRYVSGAEGGKEATRRKSFTKGYQFFFFGSSIMCEPCRMFSVMLLCYRCAEWQKYYFTLVAFEELSGRRY